MPDRPSLLLLPGLLCDAAVWRHQAAALAETHDTLVPDFFGLDAIATMAELVLDRAPRRFSLAGHSMGARVALEVLRRAPDRVERLALLDTGVHPRRSGEEERRRELVDLAYERGMAALAERWLPPMLHPDRLADAPLMAELTAMVCRATPEIHEGQIRALLGRPDASAQLSGIAVPTLLACGRQDAWSPLAQHEAMATAIPGAELVVIEDSGHMAPAERPEAVTAALARWLRTSTRT
ncbi:alpha/beta fold hydrolase [Arenibaculum pallidiluteum]|uniref:alpha/beta fold hydrolase n=1 Tax=Arenibaculum pallidiluteum TaxID=2812559 RepID=UPI001F2ECB65|nr:alpha/beta fold hydrolase [Arenibaculum pallidiluteum]